MEVPHDPWNAAQFVTDMQKEGLTMIEISQTVNNISEPMKEFEALVLSGNLRHDGNPATTWMMSNVVCRLDKKDNVFPYKEKDENKIGGAVAAILSLSRAMLVKRKKN
ncbi:MAG: hypothetical protein GY874_17565 [Desulfobacteraceae bacterium]|nr:hypothetical protein [Desulfobacteraceae bacterium]